MSIHHSQVQTGPTLRSRLGRGSFWFFSIVIALIAFFGSSLGVFLDSQSEGVAHLVHYLETGQVQLVAHIVFGPLALVLMPFQFWKGLRTRNSRVHRMIGYTYVVSILVAGVASLAMLPLFKGTLWAMVGFGVLAVAWIGTTARAVMLARARNIADHQKWMVRSAALTFAAVTLRVGALPLVIAGMPLLDTYNITAWASWLVPLAFVEVVKPWQRRRASQ